MTGGSPSSPAPAPSPRDWYEWHRPYDDVASPLAVRLGIVQELLASALDESKPGEIRLVSLCAGQGRDVIGVLARHPRAVDVHARLVERDGRNVAVARQLAAAAGMGSGGHGRLQIVEGDASTSDAFAGMAPADVVLLCGIFGNVPDEDIANTVRCVPAALAHGAVVIWTRHRRPPDLTGAVRRWFEEAGFEEIGFVGPEAAPHVGVGAARWPGPDGELRRGVRLFGFSDEGL